MLQCRYPHDNFLKTRKRLSVPHDKEGGTERGRMPDRKSHSGLTGHQDLNLGPGSGLQPLSSEDIPPFGSGPSQCGMGKDPKHSNHNSVGV